MSPQMGSLLVDEVVPRLRAAASSVAAIGHEDREELVADMTANAAKMIDSAERAGKKFSAGNIAYFRGDDSLVQSQVRIPDNRLEKGRDS